MILLLEENTCCQRWVKIIFLLVKYVIRKLRYYHSLALDDLLYFRYYCFLRVTADLTFHMTLFHTIFKIVNALKS